MSKLITSAYDDLDQITVDQAMKDPTVIPERLIQSLKYGWVEDFLFRRVAGNAGSVAFREAAAEVFSDEGIEEIAEFAEIPVISPDEKKKAKVAFAVKSGGAFRVSYEQRTENRWDAVNRAQTALQRRMFAHGVRAVEKVLASADIPEIQLTKRWDQGGDIIKDLLDGMTVVSDAHEEGRPLDRFGYVPNAILYNSSLRLQVHLSEQMQKFYIGDMAHANPVFNGYSGRTGKQLFGQLEEADSQLIPKNHIYIFEKGTPGFISDTIPLTATPLYSEGGQSELGGPTMSWRSDLVRKRAIGVDNPKAVVRLVLPDA